MGELILYVSMMACGSDLDAIGDRSYSVRIGAENRLDKLGFLAIPSLRDRISNTNDPEVVHRVGRLLQTRLEENKNRKLWLESFKLLFIYPRNLDFISDVSSSYDAYDQSVISDHVLDLGISLKLTYPDLEMLTTDLTYRVWYLKGRIKSVRQDIDGHYWERRDKELGVLKKD